MYKNARQNCIKTHDKTVQKRIRKVQTPNVERDAALSHEDTTPQGLADAHCSSAVQ